MIFRIPKIKLGNKIALIYFILGFASLIAVNLIWLLPSLTETRKNAATLQLEIAKRGAIEINSFLDYKIGSLENIGPFLRPQEIEKNREILDNFLQKEQVFFEITLIDGTGQERIKVSQFEIFSESELTSRADEEYFQKALGGIFFVSRVFFSEKAEP